MNQYLLKLRQQDFNWVSFIYNISRTRSYKRKTLSQSLVFWDTARDSRCCLNKCECRIARKGRQIKTILICPLASLHTLAASWLNYLFNPEYVPLLTDKITSRTRSRLTVFTCQVQNKSHYLLTTILYPVLRYLHPGYSRHIHKH